MARQGIAFDYNSLRFDPFPHLLGKFYIPYGDAPNNPSLKNFICADDLKTLLYPFTYKIEYSFNPLQRRQFRYHYLVLLDKNNKILKIIKNT